MDIKRTYKTIEMKNGRKLLTVEFDDPRYAILSTFLFADYKAFSDWFDQKIQEVLDHEKESNNVSGNVCELMITEKTTKVYDTLADDGMGAWCEIETEDLLSLIHEWKEKSKELSE